MKNLISIIVLSLFTMALAFFANKAYESSLKYEKAYSDYAQTKTVQNNAQAQVEHLITNLLGSLLDAKAVEKKEDNSLLKISKLENITMNNFLFFVIILIISVFSYFILNKTIFLAYLHTVALFTLLLGVISPIFLMYITTNIASNEIILQFESSNILYSIEKLILQDNYFVGGIILFFSIVFPFVKTIISFISIFFKNANIVSRFTNFMSKFNKFSMADVFVLSIFLVYLSPNETSAVKTNLEVGFYFFFTYVILSLLISLINYKSDTNTSN